MRRKAHEAPAHPWPSYRIDLIGDWPAARRLIPANPVILQMTYDLSVYNWKPPTPPQRWRLSAFLWGQGMNHRVEVEVEGAAGGVAMSRASRAGLVERLWAAAELQVEAHEARLKGLAEGEAGSEAQAKSLATLARTIKELIDMDAAAIDIDRALEDADNPHGTDPDRALADLASLREALAQQMGLLEPERQGDPSGVPPGS